MSNSLLVTQCRAQNPKAQTALYNQYCDGMFVVASRYLKDTAEAEDAMQVAFIKAFKKIEQFKPEFILLSAGFDAHKDDPLAQLQLESKDFYNITKRTLELSKQYCDGKVVSILEGGYDLLALQESTEMHVKALLEFN